MTYFCAPSLILLLITTGLAATINSVDRFDEFHIVQEELKAKLHHFEAVFGSEIEKLKLKVEQLETKVQEQDILLKECNRSSRKIRQSENEMPLAVVEENNSNKRRSLDPKTCMEAQTSDPSLESGMYWIDPDGHSRGDDPIYVYCNMTTGSTSILHDAEDSIDVGHCFDPGCYSRKIKYNATLRQIAMLSELSNECHQSIKIDCFDAALDFNGVAYAWWNDRNGDPRYFWSGLNKNSSIGYHTCQCGLDGSCKEKSLPCNCDSDLAIELADDGIVTDKNLLPVTQLNFGRTIAPTSKSRHTLGRLECSGKVVLDGMPASCQDLWRIGYSLSGLYSVKGSSNKVETVYCDLTKLPGDQGMETWIGYSDVKSTPVYFTVQRNSTYNAQNTVLTYELEPLNLGNAFNISSGVFTAPRSGTYTFAFTSISDVTYNYLWFSLQLNDEQIANCQPNYSLYICSIPYTVELKSGDRIQMFFTQGSTNNVVFTGWLVAENIFPPQ